MDRTDYLQYLTSAYWDAGKEGLLSIRQIITIRSGVNWSDYETGEDSIYEEDAHRYSEIVGDLMPEIGQKASGEEEPVASKEWMVEELKRMFAEMFG